MLGPVSARRMPEIGYDLSGPAATTELWRDHRLLVTVNFLGLPSVAVPTGLDEDGLPTGVQLIGPRNADHISLAAARDVEAALGGPDPCRGTRRRSRRMSALEPGLEFVFELRVEVSEPIRVGRTASEDLNVTPIVGGTVSGPRLNGRVLRVGADWWVTRGATTQLDARYLIEADDGAAVDVVNRGYWHAGEDVERRLYAGEDVGEDELYYRTAFVFQTGAEAHRWLTEAQFVGYARPEPGHVCIRVFRVR